MSDFKLAKIYKIVPLNSNDDSDVYIGSTCKTTLLKRMSKHRENYKRWKEGKYGNMSSFKLFEKYSINNCNIFLIEEFPCDSKDELRQREGYYIKVIPCVNQRIAGRTKKQYKYEHKEYLQTKFNCICGGCFSRCNKSRHYKTKKHINYMKKNDDIMNKINEIIASIKNDNLINN
jgi:hypothetical protein